MAVRIHSAQSREHRASDFSDPHFMVGLSAASKPWVPKAGRRGDASPQSKNQRGRPPINKYISVTSFLTRLKICIFQQFQNKVVEILRRN